MMDKPLGVDVRQDESKNEKDDGGDSVLPHK